MTWYKSAQNQPSQNPPYDREVLNGFMRKFQDPGYKGGNHLWGKTVQMSAQEVQEFQKVLMMAEQKLQSFLTGDVKRWYDDFQQWNASAGADLIRLTWPNSVVRNGGKIRDLQKFPDHVEVPEGLYHYLSWERIVKMVRDGLQSLSKSQGVIDDNHMMYGTDATTYMNYLRTLKQLIG